VDLAFLQERLAVLRHRLDELDLLGVTEDRLGHEPGDLSVEALDVAGGRVLHAEERLVELGADDELPALLDGVERRARWERGDGRRRRRRLPLGAGLAA